ncbi:MAG: stage 0 sporulation family protein [Chloroflexi bacterium]|nr:stage 0 sporulation family protein [Chloroflexota bacterium]
MPDVAGVRFRRGGRVYYFDPAGLPLKVNDQIVVETARGLELALVVIAPHQVVENELTEPLKPVLRRATEEDLQQQAQFRERELEARQRCREMVRQLELPMKVLDAEYNLDGSRLTIHFSAEGRVDFRELLRQLSASLHTRVELRQLGARDEAKLTGGLGPCGRPLCCSHVLNEFCPVSIRMAKDQDLPLNPAKISGLCGRLMCCLTFEHAQYKQLKVNLPRSGQRVATPTGPGVVVGGNALKQTVTVRLESEALVEFPLDQVVVPPLDAVLRLPKEGRAPLPGGNELVPGSGPGGPGNKG